MLSLRGHSGCWEAKIMVIVLDDFQKAKVILSQQGDASGDNACKKS